MFKKSNKFVQKNPCPKSIKRLDCSVEWDNKSIKKDASGRLTIKGYANTKDRDRVGDVVEPEAFRKQLPEFMENPVLLYMHDWDRPCGKIIKAEIDEKGLVVEAEITNAKSAADIRDMVKDGTLKTFSIGYNELDADWDKETATNFVKEVELLEISIVTIPCNTQAKFEVKPDSSEEDTEDDSEGKSGNEPDVTKGIISDDQAEFMAQMINMMDSEEKVDAELIVEISKTYSYMKSDKSELIEK